MLIRLQKIIAQAGIVSRRKAEELIIQGRVTVNGEVVTKLGTKADTKRDRIKVDGKLIRAEQPLAYYMMYKPKGYVTTMSDPEGRPTVANLLKGIKTRVYPVGRLDYGTEGLLLLTNDGAVAHALMHPRYEIQKSYRAKIKGVLTDEQILRLQRGVILSDGRTAPCIVKKIRKTAQNSWIEITVHEGKKHQVRRMLEKTGHPVLKLKRVRYGFLELGGLLPGEYRALSPSEVKRIKSTAVKTAAPR